MLVWCGRESSSRSLSKGPGGICSSRCTSEDDAAFAGIMSLMTDGEPATPLWYGTTHHNNKAT